MNRQVVLLIVLAVVAVGMVGFLAYQATFETVTKTEYHLPPSKPEDELTDDRLAEKNPSFDPELVDRRPEGDWLINQSAAVIRLNVAAAKPDQDAELLVLHPSYAAAVAAGRQHGREVLPSVNLLDGK